MTYPEKLKDPRWQKKRLEIMERDNWTCQNCDNKDSTLNVHHWIYGKNPWDSDSEHLTTLCEKCHKEVKAAWDDVILEVLYGVINENADLSFIEKLKETKNILSVFNSWYVDGSAELCNTMPLIRDLVSATWNGGRCEGFNNGYERAKNREK